MKEKWFSRAEVWQWVAAGVVCALGSGAVSAILALTLPAWKWMNSFIIVCGMMSFFATRRTKLWFPITGRAFDALVAAAAGIALIKAEWLVLAFAAIAVAARPVVAKWMAE